MKTVAMLRILAVAALAAACSAVGGAQDVLVIAHRGGSMLGNENTLSCIRAGMEAGADMIEIDVHQTADGHIVACHDETVGRTTDGKGRIEDMTLEEVRSFRITDRDGKATEECIPTLEEVLEVIGGRCPLLLEIKRKAGQYEGIEARVLEILGQYGALDNTVIQSFTDIVIENTHALMPEVRVEKLLSTAVPAKRLVEKYGYAASFNFHYKALTPSLLEDLHALGKEVKIWTVNSVEALPQLPVDGVITDCPDVFLEHFGK